MRKNVPLDLQKIGGTSPEKQTNKVQALGDMMVGLLRDNYKLPDADTFMKLATVNITGVESTVVSFTMPDAMTGVLKYFGHDAKTTDAFLYTTWRLLKNGVPLADFGAFTLQLGSISSPKPMTERLLGGDKIELRAITTGGTYEVYGLLEGWYYSV